MMTSIKRTVMTAAPVYNITLSCEPITVMSSVLVTISGGMTKPRAQPIYSYIPYHAARICTQSHFTFQLSVLLRPNIEQASIFIRPINKQRYNIDEQHTRAGCQKSPKGPTLLAALNHRDQSLIWSVSNSSPVHVLSHVSGPVSCQTTFGKRIGPFLTDRLLMPIHASCRSRDVVFTMMLFGCTRAICELKGIYNGQLKVLIYVSMANSVLINTRSMKSVVKYVVVSHRHFVLLDNNESCPTADRSNTGRSNGQAYQTSELFNMTLKARFLSQSKSEINIPLSANSLTIH